MKKIHNVICDNHKNHSPEVQLSLDGVLEAKSSFNSLDTYSIKFLDCQNIYPIRIVKPCEKYRYDEQEQLREVLQDINDNDLVIDSAVFDNPKRSNVRCAKSACAKFGCEYCESCAVSFIDSKKKSLTLIRKKYDLQEKNLSQEIEEMRQTQTQDDQEQYEQLQNLEDTLASIIEEKETELKKKGRKQLTWPASTMGGNLRTVERINEISNEIVNNPDVLKSNPDFCKGIKGKSLMLDQPNFHITNDMPCEYMHLVCLGVVKRMTELNFKVGENRERQTKRKLSPPNMFNELIKCIQVCREFSRRCRNLDFGVMKASEFRNLILFFFPIILDCIEADYEDDKRVWLHLVFMIRACVLPNNEFERVDNSLVESACRNFYVLYEKLFGQINCTYSIHVVSHILKIRGDRPLTEKSAFRFESFFSEMKNLYHPGTLSTIKQILQNCFMKRILEYHHCEKHIFYCAQKKGKGNPGKENNSLIYTFNEEKKVSIYTIIEIINENSFKCHKHGKFVAKFPLTPEYDWSDVGVFKVGPMSEESCVVNKETISGKVLLVNGYFITCPINVLVEQ